MRFVDGMNGVAFAGNVSRCGPGKSLAALSAENGGRLALDEVLRIADVLLFHVAQAHKRGERVRGLHASSIVRLPDGSLVVEPTSRAHARASASVAALAWIGLGKPCPRRVISHVPDFRRRICATLHPVRRTRQSI